MRDYEEKSMHSINAIESQLNQSFKKNIWFWWETGARICWRTSRSL